MVEFLFLAIFWARIRNSNLTSLSQTFQTARDQSFAQWYKVFSDDFVRYECTTNVPELVASCHGLVLELGPGAGNQLPRFDASRIKHIYGVEPNTGFAGVLADRLKEIPELGAKYTPVFCAVENRAELARQGLTPGSVDCVLSMQVVCSLQKPRETAQELYELLKPGGELIFWEHCRSEDLVTRTVQTLWSMFWSVVAGGCRFDVPTREILLQAAEWEVVDIQIDKAPHLIMPRVWGRLVKPRRAAAA
ncbi:S-adenosyl-L-methionine-dependent methyltransferase [Diplogelasinospora grovesii]|uniref:S-adenosyl-L-methionine-dependent methyltransferase n=1 Tax=Diplogelasinospora grovesii TaxID=303347 RepID=A0AAN6NCZ9_9PEZI|nr:S-adenosyl-L-methionine-dependent methyltransferase [Diplogelasinospora grovesii]